MLSEHTRSLDFSTRVGATACGLSLVDTASYRVMSLLAPCCEVGRPGFCSSLRTPVVRFFAEVAEGGGCFCLDIGCSVFSCLGVNDIGTVGGLLYMVDQRLHMLNVVLGSVKLLRPSDALCTASFGVLRRRDNVFTRDGAINLTDLRLPLCMNFEERKKKKKNDERCLFRCL